MTEDLKPSRRGRKPLGERAMTPAEAKRRSRERQAQQGVTEFSIRLAGGTLRFIDGVASAWAMPRSEVIFWLLDLGIAKLANAIADYEAIKAAGGTDEAANAAMEQVLSTVPRPSSIAKFKEVLALN